MSENKSNRLRVVLKNVDQKAGEIHTRNSALPSRCVSFESRATRVLRPLSPHSLAEMSDHSLSSKDTILDKVYDPFLLISLYQVQELYL